MSLSKFLPTDYRISEPIAILAGRGDYPKILAARMRELNVPVRLIAMKGETADDLVESFPKEERRMIKVGQVGKLLKSLRELKCCYNVMAGQVKPGKLFRGIQPDVKALQILNSLKERNADTIFGAIVAEMEAIGVRCLDARVFLDDHMAANGLMTGGKLRVSEDTLQHGIRMANEVANLDIGQGVIVKRGTVLCVEEFDGTDSMLKRSARFDYDDKLFVKTVKPNQNYAFDVPVFGENTIQSMIEGGVKIAALAADRTIILNKPEVLALAKTHKIQLLGFE